MPVGARWIDSARSLGGDSDRFDDLVARAFADNDLGDHVDVASGHDKTNGDAA